MNVNCLLELPTDSIDLIQSYEDSMINEKEATLNYFDCPRSNIEDVLDPEEIDRLNQNKVPYNWYVGNEDPSNHTSRVVYIRFSKEGEKFKKIVQLKKKFIDFDYLLEIIEQGDLDEWMVQKKATLQSIPLDEYIDPLNPVGFLAMGASVG